MGKAAVFIDAGHIDKILLSYGKLRINYESFLARVCAPQELYRAYYYACLPYQGPNPTTEERERLSGATKFFTSLQGIERFKIRWGHLAPRGKNSDGTTGYIQKRVDLCLGIDLTSLILKNRPDIAVLVTGDSDFIPAVEFAQQEGVILRLVHGPSGTFHRELWNLADERIEMTKDFFTGMLR